MVSENSQQHIAPCHGSNTGDRPQRAKKTKPSQLASWLRLFSTITGWCLIQTNPLKAQITPDGTVGTEVNTTDNVTEITGGTRADSNLFHSFSDFSVATGNTAFFNNATDISNVIGRVTGGNISNIDGLIKANGNANLILINPNGIIFGADARLDIGGSFLGSSADSVVFADGTAFGANNTQVDPVLTVSVPVGLQLGQNSGEINVTGGGHNLNVVDPLFSPIAFGQQTGLRVKAGQTLGLVGGELNFNGGTIAAPGGKIALGSVSEGLVNLDFSDNGLNLSYTNISAFNNIQLRSQSLADVTGTETIAAGTIEVEGRQVSLNNGSLFLAQNTSPQTAGNINITANESVTVSGTSNDGTIRSSITNETLGVGNGGNINIDTNRLNVNQGGTVVAKTLSPVAASGGNIAINATESVAVTGSSSVNPSVTSSVVAASFGTGRGGNNSITTNSLTASAGATIAATAFNTGDGGDISITADSIELIGIEPNVFAPSAISASTLGAGNAGNLTIDTSTISLLQGGRLDASTAAGGNAGNVTINATDSITIDGTVSESINPSLIIASANILDPTLRELLMTPDVPSGNSGNINLTTSQLTISGTGQLTVRNDGLGDAGTLNVAADAISLNSGGAISAAVQNGRGGDINLEIQDSVSLTSGSQISSDNLGMGGGGTIKIATDNLAIANRSFISATTFGDGDGGDISISATEIDIVGTGFAEFQQTFQLAALNGSIQPDTRGTGIFIGTAATGKGGNLSIEAQSLSLSEGSIIFSPVFTTGEGGNINVDAADIKVNASAIQVGGAVGTVEPASLGNINLETERLTIANGGTAINLTFGDADGGDINILASESIVIEDSPVDTIVLSGIYTNTTFGSGTGGNININTGKLKLQDGIIGSNSGTLLPDGTVIPVGGKGGDINIQATESIESIGFPSRIFLETGIGSSTYTASDAGNMSISTGTLTISEGANFATATLGSGEGGQFAIDATDSIELVGIITPNGIKRGGLLATSGRIEFPQLAATGASGDIILNTPQLTVRDGASIDVQSLSIADAGTLTIDSESIVLNNRASISASTLGGIGGNIEIATNNLEVNQSLINASVFGEGTGGNVQINARDTITLAGSGFEFLQNTFFDPSALSPEFLASLDFSVLQEGIVAVTTGQGIAGTIEITTDNLEIREGGLVATATAGNGAANSLFLNAAESIKIDSSIISASTIFNGQGGNIDINTDKLSVLGGSQITTSTLGAGNSGNLTINATESIDVSGTSSNNTLVSNIISGALPLPSATGNGGNLTIATSELNISDRGAISVGSVGTGDAGTLSVDANIISLARQGTISADTQSGGGGNIRLNTDNLILTGASNTTATSSGDGNGGNIALDSNNILLLENSQIFANAVVGMGGNIEIDTESLFRCPSCQIVASSRLGVDGIVQIDTLQPNTQLEVLNIPTQPTTPSESVAVACPSNTRDNTSELTITGRGGLPPRPQEPLNSKSMVTFASPGASTQERSELKTPHNSLLPPPARSWYMDSQGTVVLSSRVGNTTVNNSPANNLNCQAN